MIIEILILIAGIPVGLYIAWLASDELKEGRKYFRILVIIGLIGAVGFWLYGRNVEAFSSGFIAVVSLTGLLADGKLMKRKV
jgi:drug/metabolite transporter (DMT)-like permease